MSSENGKDKSNKLIPFFPDYILDEAIAWYIALALLIVLASLFPAGLEEQALDWLERSYQERESRLVYAKVDPVFEDLRNNPRFHDLVRRMNLEP